MTALAKLKQPTAASLAEHITALEAELGESAEALRLAEAQAIESASVEIAHRKAQVEVEKLQQRISEQTLRLERLKEVHSDVVGCELDEEIAELRKKDQRLRVELEQLGEKTARAREAEEKRHKAAMDKINQGFDEACQHTKETQVALAEALTRKAEANADEVAHLILLRDQARQKVQALRQDLQAAELNHHAADEQYNQACREGQSRQNLEVYRDHVSSKQAHIESLRERQDKVAEDIGRFTALLRDLGGDPDHSEV